RTRPPRSRSSSRGPRRAFRRRSPQPRATRPREVRPPPPRTLRRPRPPRRRPRPHRIRARSSPLEPVSPRPSPRTRTGRRGRACPDGVFRAPGGVPQEADRLPDRDLRGVPRVLELGAPDLRVPGGARAEGPPSRPESLLHDPDRALPDVLSRGPLRRNDPRLAGHPVAVVAFRRARSLPAREAVRRSVRRGGGPLFLLPR